MSKNNDKLFNTWVMPDVMERFNMYAAEALLQYNSEIGGFIKVEDDDTGAVFVSDLYIPPQEASMASFDVTAEMDNKFLQAMMKAGKMDEIHLWKGLIHSHPEKMDPGMSSVDVDAIKRRAEDQECFSLIMTASRKADSDESDLFMHYCGNFHGRKLVFQDMPARIGWQGSRLTMANTMAESLAKKLGASTKSDLSIVSDALQAAICNLPPTFEEDRKKLRESIRLEVREKISTPAPSSGWSTYGMGYGVQHYSGGFNRSQRGSQARQKAQAGSVVPYQERADMDRMKQTVKRLYSIAYEMVDPANNDPQSYVTKEDAEKARILHRKTITELNEKLREYGGYGMGDLVLVNADALDYESANLELMYQPTEIDDFELIMGTISYDVSDDTFNEDELDLVTTYETVMGWKEDESKVIVA